MQDDLFERRQKWRTKRHFLDHLYASDMPTSAKALLMRLCDSGEASFRSEDTLAREMTMSRRTVCTHLRLARDRGWLTIHKRPLRGGRFDGNSYALHVPDDAILPETGPFRAQDLHTVAPGRKGPRALNGSVGAASAKVLANLEQQKAAAGAQPGALPNKDVLAARAKRAGGA